ncbi:MAG TPA: hypothetical protein VNA04_00460 [Thermoanaerobaculia bacterium]|nr:hypothetical protein [Thermoanaerobaculia bacterium]
MRTAVGIALMLVIGCTETSTPPVTRASAVQQPKWMVEEPTTTVEPSAAVKALLRDDPDVRDLTPEEVKAALAAAQTQPAGGPALVEGAERSQLEKENAEREAARQVRLRASVMVAPGDSRYHAAGCGSLTVVEDAGGQTRRVYVGSAITLQAALDREMSPHSECGAPAADPSFPDLSSSQ